MRKKNGFAISTTLYSIFGIMLLTVFYILYALSNNRYLVTSSIDGIKEKINNIAESSTDSTTDNGNIVYEDTSGANEPVLADGMIPVVYNAIKEVWVRADTEAGWYAYQDQVWANAVTVTSTNRATYLSDSHIGKEIPMDEINSMWVWIPRFKYNIPSDLGSSSAITNPPQINVTFETGTAATGVTEEVYRAEIDSGRNSNYYTHPAFRNGSQVYNTSAYDIGGWSKELTGFWVGKFESSFITGSSTILIKPNGNSWTTSDLVNQFIKLLSFSGGSFTTSTGSVKFTADINNVYGLNTTTTTTDTHMMKNIEWGAVAILSQSQYGKRGNEMYTGENKEIYQNVSSVTGKSNGTPSSGTTDTECVYNDIVDRGNGTGACGAGASTTGTIYGVYDMNGGSERVMGFYLDVTVNRHFGTLPPARYYDEYEKGAYFGATVSLDVTILGDAMAETKNWCSDNPQALVNDYPIYSRGNISTSNGKDGIFGADSIGMGNGSSCRPTLIP